MLALDFSMPKRIDSRAKVFPIIAGIYTITNRASGKVYVGQSIDILRRERNHRRSINAKNLDRQKGALIAMWHDGKGNYKENFSFSIVAQTVREKYALREAEVWWELHLRAQGLFLYNMVGCGASPGRHCQAVRDKIGKSGLGRVRSPVSQEVKDKISATLRGRGHTPQMLINQRAAYERQTLEERRASVAKRQKTLAGRSQEAILRSIEKQKRTVSARSPEEVKEVNAKISKALRGKPKTKEHKESLCRAAKRRDAEERAANAEVGWLSPTARKKRVAALSSDAVRAKMSASAKIARSRPGALDYLYIPWRNVDTGEVFATITLAAASVDRSANNLRYTHKKNKPCGGFMWERANADIEQR
jgi:group I intron endonuclease